MQNKTEKFTIEQLVAIGDAIHNCDTAFLIANTELSRTESSTKNEGMVCVKGSKDDVVQILYQTFKKDEDIFNIVQEAMSLILVEKLQDIINKNK